MTTWITADQAMQYVEPGAPWLPEVQRLAQTVIEQAAALERSHRHEAEAWEALRKVPGYPHVRTARDESGAASLAVNIEQLAAELAEAKATIRKVQDAWEGYAEDDMGEVPWRLQRDMNGALDLEWSGR